MYVSIDGNFGLVRKLNSGSSQLEPKHEGRFFIPSHEVDKFVEEYDDNSSLNIKVCFHSKFMTLMLDYVCISSSTIRMVAVYRDCHALSLSSSKY